MNKTALPGALSCGLLTPRSTSTGVQRSNRVVCSPEDTLAEEVPVALVYNGISHAVMMATPGELTLFALGFSLSEGIAASPGDIYDIEEIPVSNGIEVSITLSTRAFDVLKHRRRSMTGRTGCGLCGLEQIEDIFRPLPVVPATQIFSLDHLDDCLKQLESKQALSKLTGCTHAAAWLSPSGQVAGLCEDVSRHVALDKLLGLRERQGWRSGAALITSRASYEMVQKAARCGVEILFAVSAATLLAVDTARQCRMSLVGFSRPGRAVVYTMPERFAAGAGLKQ